MHRPNLEEIEKSVEKKANKRSKKNKLKMKVSGTGVKKLQKIISY
jgi:hypothetical protein